MAYEIEHHATMLTDTVRLELYRKALEKQITQNESVADLGTGTGILASYAAQLTKAPVYGIEYFAETAALAKALAKNSYPHLEILQKSSYETQLFEISVLVSETIGTLGPEENIVEGMWDFCRRHPSIRTLIPHTLTLYALPICSLTVSQHLDSLLSAHSQASHNTFRYEEIYSLLKGHLCKKTFQVRAQDVVPVGKPISLVRYSLGKTKSSAFQIDLDLSVYDTMDALHFYFIADLGKNLQLSSAFNEPLTHWRHNYLRKQEGHSFLHLSYCNRSRHFSFEWRKHVQ